MLTFFLPTLFHSVVQFVGCFRQTHIYSSWAGEKQQNIKQCIFQRYSALRRPFAEGEAFKLKTLQSHWNANGANEFHTMEFGVVSPRTPLFDSNILFIFSAIQINIPDTYTRRSINSTGDLALESGILRIKPSPSFG